MPENSNPQLQIAVCDDEPIDRRQATALTHEIMEAEGPDQSTAPAVGQVAVVYIGTKAGGFTLEGGDPDTLDIWFCMEGDQPLKLPDLGLSWPIDRPYQWTGAQRESLH